MDLSPRQSLLKCRQSSKRLADFGSLPEVNQERGDDEENKENGSSANRSTTNNKRMKESNAGWTSARTSNKDAVASAASYNDPSVNSNADNFTVQKLKGSASEQQKDHFDVLDAATKTKLNSSPDGRKTSIACTKSNSIIAHSIQKNPSSTPLPASAPHASTPGRIRFTPRIRKEEIQATNDSHASVDKLSKWLSDDPFEKQKELRVARRGAKIVSKARAFEPLPQNDATRTVAAVRACNISDRKQWLQNAFNGNDKCDRDETPTVSDRAKWLQTAFKPKKDGNPHLRTAVSGSQDFDDNSSREISEPFRGSQKLYHRSTDGMLQHGKVFVVESSWSVGEDISVASSENGSENVSACLDNSLISSASTGNVSDAPVLSSFSTGKMILQSRMEGNVMQAAETFGGTARLTSVQRKKVALEQRELEMKKKADPRGSMLKAKWEVDETSHTYKKKLVDAPRNTPKKKLSDLP